MMPLGLVRSFDHRRRCKELRRSTHHAKPQCVYSLKNYQSNYMGWIFVVAGFEHASLRHMSMVPVQNDGVSRCYCEILMSIIL